MPQQKICTKLSMNLFKIVYRQKKKKKRGQYCVMVAINDNSLCIFVFLIYF